MLKIDLHCHTKKIKSGDGDGRNVTPELFREKIIDANVKIVAITNHNTFDYEQYEVLRQKVIGICSVWPGVEIDIKGSNDKRFHLIVVANPDNVKDFADRVKVMYSGKNLETCTFRIQEVYDNLDKCDVIYIPHYHKKPSISDEDKAELEKIVGDPSRIFVELQDLRSLGVFANYDYKVIIGSDVKEWDKYEECTFADLRLPVENFSQFCLLAKRDPVVVNTLLGKKNIYSLKASPYKGIKLDLKVYSDINIIFGQKGTGKSEILSSMYDDMKSRGITCIKYEAANRDDEFGSLLRTNDMFDEILKLDKDYCEKEIEYLKKWSDYIPTLFSKYVDWYKTRDNNANKSRMRITEAHAIRYVKTRIVNKHSEDYKDIKRIRQLIDKIDVKNYIPEEDITFMRLFNELIQSIQKAVINDTIEEQACYLTDYSLEKIKNIADKNSDSVSKPSTTGFKEFAIRRIELKKVMKKIIDELNDSAINTKEYLGEIEEKGKLYINKKYRMLCEESRSPEFRGRITILREIKKVICDVYNNVFEKSEFVELENVLLKIEEEKIKSLQSFVGMSKQVVTDSGDEYKPSNGEKGILLLQMALNEEKDAYFLDEPELGMGNSYVDTNIRPLISDLARRNKVVVVATHNANVAVRTLPYMTIFRTHENGVYNTYVGNPFNDCLTNIYDETDVRSWTEESLHTLEGGPEAFYERKNIYESKNNMC